MQLHPFTVELFFDDEFSVTHFLDRVFDLLRRPFAQHRGKGMEKLDGFILDISQTGEFNGPCGLDTPLHSFGTLDPIVPKRFS